MFRFWFLFLIISAFSKKFVVAVSIDKFYPFGNEDHQLPNNLYEVSSQQIPLSVPVKFYGETYSYIYVNANGLLSFLAPLPYFLNVPFPLDYPVIAPFYANVDTRRSGNVFYRETRDPVLLKRAQNDIQRLFPYSGLNFVPASLFVATWSKVGYYDKGYDKVNTYQAVIITNGLESYVEFLYSDDGLQWLQSSISSNNTGVLDAKAQAGLVAFDGRVYVLKGSGTDQVRNLNRWSNTGIPGVWMFKVGNVGSSGNVELPQISSLGAEEVIVPEKMKSCSTGYTLCHSEATCRDFFTGFCCFCKEGFYGNGYNCIKKDTPIRANGKVNVTIHGLSLPQLILQAYVAVADGRIYVAASKVSPSHGHQFQLLYPLSIVLGWLFAKPVNGGYNGYQITGGVLNYTAQVLYKDTGDVVSITQRYMGLDVFDQLSIEVNIRGSLPPVTNDLKITIEDFQHQFVKTSPGVFHSVVTSSSYVTPDNVHHAVSIDQTITYSEACSSNVSDIPTTYRVKTARNFVDYETKENLLRFAATNKVSLWSESDDPCAENRVKCVANSTCIVEVDSFKCVCNPGFQTLYVKIETASQEGFGCFDINECSEGVHNCDQNAICVNEIGTYSCQCKPGYSGNGFYCSELESPCLKYPTLCNPPNSHCADSADPNTCTCNQGFNKTYIDEKRIAFACRDVDECVMQKPCSANAVCYNTEGSYLCECNPGFTGNGIECTKLLTPTSRCDSVRCREGFVCISDSYGETKCVCKAGYVQVGDNCEPAPQSTPSALTCDVARDCSPNAECIYNETSQAYTCKCIRGYYGDGYTCSRYSVPRTVPKYCILGSCWCPAGFVEKNDVCIEVEEGQTPPTRPEGVSCNVINICHPNAQCVYNVSTSEYKCQCNAGYEGNGFDCAEVETSCKKIDNCDMHATCQVDESSGHAMCVCNPSYQGDGLHCVYTGHCLSDGDCGQNEECIFDEKTDGYDCRCISGFVKNTEGVCIEQKKCPECHQYAECISTVSVVSEAYCQCVAGYTGDGVTKCTVLPPPCNIINNCSPFASCLYNASIPGFSCVCRKGYEGNGTYCYSTKTCAEEPEVCHKDASCVTRRRGSTAVPVCECNPGFIGNGTYCSEIPKQEGEFLLLNHGIATLRMPFQPTPSDPTYPIQLQPTQTAIGIAVDCVEGRVYWTDVTNRVIRSSTYKGNDIQDFVRSNISSPEGVTIDWINRVLYWTDSDKDTIESIKLDRSERTVVISSGLVNPRGITVHPYKRKLFWSDWNRAKPKIEYSNLDGSERRTLVEGSNVQLPNSAEIDWSKDELCWADAGTKTIECIGIDSQLSRTAVANISYPFGLAITRDRYYWTDWATGKVGTSDKRGNKLESLTVPLTGSGRPYGITAVPPRCP